MLYHVRHVRMLFRVLIVAVFGEYDGESGLARRECRLFPFLLASPMYAFFFLSLPGKGRAR